MKRSEIKRKTPLKRTAFKKKPKRKKKTALQKRIDKMDSPYWDKKCKAAVAEFCHMSRCMLCCKREPEVRLIAGHHIIRKSRSRFLRWHPKNIVPLCELHHLTSIHYAPHSDNPLAVRRFLEKLEELAPAQYAWLLANQGAIRKISKEVGQIERPDWRYQYEIWQQRIRDTRIIQEQ